MEIDTSMTCIGFRTTNVAGKPFVPPPEILVHVTVGSGLIPPPRVIDEKVRHPDWPALEREHLRKEPHCYACFRQGPHGNHVHHIKPVHLFPEFELDPDNLLTMCPACHLVLGHFGCWSHYNPHARTMVTIYHMKMCEVLAMPENQRKDYGKQSGV